MNKLIDELHCERKKKIKTYEKENAQKENTKKKCEFCGSNTGPPDRLKYLQSDALPTELNPQFLKACTTQKV